MFDHSLKKNKSWNENDWVDQVQPKLIHLTCNPSLRLSYKPGHELSLNLIFLYRYIMNVCWRLAGYGQHWDYLSFQFSFCHDLFKSQYYPCLAFSMLLSEICIFACLLQTCP
jgi:hypothetical protein